MTKRCSPDIRQRWHRTLAILCLAALVAGCAGHQARLAQQSEMAGGSLLILPAGSFELVAAVQPAAGPIPRLRIYLEGDGKAWATRTQPSTDPSPRDPWLARMALADRSPAAYLARPCQYHRTANCRIAWWTDLRFAQAVIDSLDAALSQLKARFGAQALELIGYSGGGALALVLAAKRSDVAQVQTFAGNLDPVAWARYHQLSPLSDAPAFSEQLTARSVPQRHFVGGQDAVVPPALVQQFIENSRPDCVEVVTLNASHHAGWSSIDADSLNRPIRCHPTDSTGVTDQGRRGSKWSLAANALLAGASL